MSRTAKDMKMEQDAIELKIKREAFDENIVEQLITEGSEKAKDLKGKDITIVIGNTGAGKSSLITYLMGATMKIEESEFREFAFPETESLLPGCKYPDIGTNAGKAQTRFPEGYTAVDKTKLCDYPGFLDPDSRIEMKIGTSVNLESAIKCAKSIKVIVVISYQELITTKAKLIRELVEMLERIFVNPTKILDSILWVVTQVPEKLAGKPTAPKGVLGAIQGDIFTSISSKLEILVKGKIGQSVSWILNMLAKGGLVSKKNKPLINTVAEALGSDLPQAEALQRQLDIIRSIKDSNLLLTNYYDVKEKQELSRNSMLNKLSSMPSVMEKEFRFDKVDDTRVLFEKIAFNVANKLNRLFDEESAIFWSIAQDNVRLKKNMELIKIYKEAEKTGNVTGLNDSRIADLRQKIMAERIALGKIEQIIEAQKIELNSYDSDEEVLHSHFSFKEERAMFPFGWLGRSEKDFKHNGIPLTRTEEIFDKEQGYFKEKTQQDLGNGECSIKYKYLTYYGEPADIKINLYTKRRDKFKDKIKSIREDLEKMENEVKKIKNKIELLNTDIQAGFASLAEEKNKLITENQLLTDKIAKTKQEQKSKNEEILALKPKFMAFFHTAENLESQEDITLIKEFYKTYKRFELMEEQGDKLVSETEVKVRAETNRKTMVSFSPASAETASKRAAKYVGWLQHGIASSSNVLPKIEATTTFKR